MNRLFAVLLALLTAACGALLPGAATPASPTIDKIADDPKDDPQTFWDEGNPRLFSYSKASAATCDCLSGQAETWLAYATASARGKAGASPTLDATTGAVGACLQKVQGPLLQGIPAPPQLADGGSPATAADNATTLGEFAQQVCSAAGLKRATALVTSAHTDAAYARYLRTYGARERTRLHRLITATHRADAVVAASSTLALAVRGGSAQPIEDAADAIGKALPIAAAPASEAELDSLMGGGERGYRLVMEMADANARAWDQDGLSRKAEFQSGDYQLPPEVKKDIAAIATALGSLQRGDVSGIIHGAAVLFPENSSIRRGLDAAEAFSRHDFKGGFEKVSELVPRDSAVGRAIAKTKDTVALANDAGKVKSDPSKLLGSGPSPSV